MLARKVSIGEPELVSPLLPKLWRKIANIDNREFDVPLEFADEKLRVDIDTKEE